MTIHSVADVYTQPEVTLRRWLILECTNGLRYATGWCVENGEGRASTFILDFDRKAMRLRTASGRIYQLQGPPGADADAAYVWHAYARLNSLTVARDATSEYWPGWSGVKAIEDKAVAAVTRALSTEEGNS